MFGFCAHSLISSFRGKIGTLQNRMNSSTRGIDFFFFFTVSAVSHSSTVRAQSVELVGVWKWAGLTGGTPAHGLSQYHRATATARLCHCRRGGIRALAVSVLGVTQIPPCL